MNATGYKFYLKSFTRVLYLRQMSLVEDRPSASSDFLLDGKNIGWFDTVLSLRFFALPKHYINLEHHSRPIDCYWDCITRFIQTDIFTQVLRIAN